MSHWFDLWWINALLAALFAALTTIFAKMGVTHLDSNLATAIRTVVVLLIAWSIVLIQKNLHQIFDIPLKTLLFLGLSGLCTGASWLFYFRALQQGQASYVAPIDKLSIVLVLLFSAMFLNEPLQLKSILGTVLIGIGTLVLIF